MTEKGESIVSLLGERIKQRSLTIALTAEQRRSERAVNSSSNENVDYFFDNFQLMKENLESKLNDNKLIKPPELITFLDGMVKDISEMQQFLNESSMFLPSFQIKKAQESINLLNELIQSSILELQPKKKFGFKTKAPKQIATSKNEESTPDGSSSSYLLNQMKERVFFGFKDSVGKTFSMESAELKNRQLNLQNLLNCKVLALGNPSSLQFTNLQNTCVLVGPTSRSALIKNCRNCKFVLACQQVRIHCCEETSFYLHVTGAAIIEDCKNVCFGPYTLEYENKDKDFIESELSLGVNNWNKVEDFNWLNENEQSPNFKLIEEINYEKNWL